MAKFPKEVNRKAKELKREERMRKQDAERIIRERGKLNLQMICPHCHTKGCVRTRKVRVKKGISGAKATGAFFTLGWSMLFTGLSKKEEVTEATCDNCKMTWHFS